MKKKIDVNSMINAQMRRKNISASDLGRKINVSRTTAYSLSQRESIPVNRLIDLSKALNYNFFTEIANQLNITQPDPRNQEGESLTEKIAKLETQLEVLKDVLGRR